jgi:hypothetical protein
LSLHASRSAVRSGPTPVAYPYRYLTIYELEGDPEAALAALAAAVPGMQISGAMDADRMLDVFEAMTERIEPKTSGANLSSP